MVSFSMQLMNTMPSPRLASMVRPTCSAVASASRAQVELDHGLVGVVDVVLVLLELVP
jgi:hypothetical protein